jgi:predicted Zn-dependent protease
VHLKINLWLRKRQRWLWRSSHWGLTVVLILCFQSSSFTLAQSTPPQPGEILPELQVHSLPNMLAAWQSSDQGNYFAQISSTSVGYLIWSEFPVKVFVQPALDQGAGSSGESSHASEWTAAVIRAVQEWSRYLPLELISAPEAADITVWRRSPPLSLDRQPGAAPSTMLFRARSAETRYELWIKRSPNMPAMLSHRCQVWLRSSQTSSHIQASARHELGHALGIWGHSPQATDALYFAQVRNPPPISPRDVNTLKQIYQQPTRLGWSVEQLAIDPAS